MRHQGQHRLGRRTHLPRPGRPVLRPYAHRHGEGRAVVLLRGRGAGGGVAAITPLAHASHNTGVHRGSGDASVLRVRELDRAGVQRARRHGASAWMRTLPIRIRRQTARSGAVWSERPVASVRGARISGGGDAQGARNRAERHCLPLLRTLPARHGGRQLIRGARGRSKMAVSPWLTSSTSMQHSPCVVLHSLKSRLDSVRTPFNWRLQPTGNVGGGNAWVTDDGGLPDTSDRPGPKCREAFGGSVGATMGRNFRPESALDS